MVHALATSFAATTGNISIGRREKREERESVWIGTNRFRRTVLSTSQSYRAWIAVAILKLCEEPSNEC